MSSKNSSSSSSGIGLGGGLLLLFIGLKLTNYIDWSWWWVFSPIWLPLAIVASILGIVALVALATGARS
jgi:hypothetical protein